MSTNADTTNQTNGSSNTTLIMFILLAVVLGVVSYIIMRYWSSLISELHPNFNGSVPAQDLSLGLSPSDVEALPTFIYKGPTTNCNGNCDATSSQNGHSDRNGVGDETGIVNSRKQKVSVDCSICLCDLQEDDVVRMLPVCKHLFHIKCIDVWLYAHHSCPICRGSLQTGSVELTECSMYPPFPHLHQCNSMEATAAANIQATKEEITSGGIVEIVVEQEAKMAKNMDKNTKRSTCSESIEVKIDLNDEMDIEMGTEECSGESISTNDALPVSNIGSPSKRIPSVVSLKTPIDDKER